MHASWLHADGVLIKMSMELQELQLMNEEAKIKAGADLEYAEVEKSELDVRLASAEDKLAASESQVAQLTKDLAASKDELGNMTISMQKLILEKKTDTEKRSSVTKGLIPGGIPGLAPPKKLFG